MSVTSNIRQFFYPITQSFANARNFLTENIVNVGRSVVHVKSTTRTHESSVASVPVYSRTADIVPALWGAFKSVCSGNDVDLHDVQTSWMYGGMQAPGVTATRNAVTEPDSTENEKARMAQQQFVARQLWLDSQVDAQSRTTTVALHKNQMSGHRVRNPGAARTCLVRTKLQTIVESQGEPSVMDLVKEEMSLERRKVATRDKAH